MLTRLLSWSAGSPRGITNLLDFALLVAVALQPMALFSNSFVMAEGRVVSFLLATLLLLFLRAGLHLELSRGEVDSHKAIGWRVRWVAIALRGIGLAALNAAMESAGLVDRSGENPFDKTSHQPGADIGTLLVLWFGRWP